MMHQVKIDTEWFVMKIDGVKHWEIRLNDRGFMVGDFLGLNETIDGKETGRFMIEEIVAIVGNTPGIREGYVMLSTRPVSLLSDFKGAIYSPFGERNRITE